MVRVGPADVQIHPTCCPGGCDGGSRHGCPTVACPPPPPCTVIPGAQCMWMPPSPVVGMLLA